jgi:hypothetical protein
MKFTLYVEEDGTTVGYCDELCLQDWKDGKGVEMPTASEAIDVYCLGCGKLLARRSDD